MIQECERQNQWNESYTRGGNICFYPHEEVVRFINRYIKKRVGIDEFEDLSEDLNTMGTNFRSLDLGCGIGRHIRLLDEFGLNPFGIDLSSKAIEKWFQSLGRGDLVDKIKAGSIVNIPYEDQSFDLCVACEVFDSMERGIAIQGLKELKRVLKSNGLVYMDLIMDDQLGNMDQIVDEGYEKDTIQSYFTKDSIKEFLGSEIQIVEFKIIMCADENGCVFDKRAHIIGCKN